MFDEDGHCQIDLGSRQQGFPAFEIRDRDHGGGVLLGVDSEGVPRIDLSLGTAPNLSVVLLHLGVGLDTDGGDKGRVALMNAKGHPVFDH